jgi:hypothetical protein
MKSEAPNDYIFAPDRVPVWSQWKTAGAKVTRIVMGTRNSPMDIGPWPDLAAQFPNLKALHLFDISDLQSISALPPHLEILDIRNCPNLTTIPPLPEGLADLVLQNLPRLTGLTTATTAIALHDVAIVRCPGVAATDINALLATMLDAGTDEPLGCLDLTGFTQIKTLPTELPNFTRIILNECKELDKLPGKLPAALTRLDLANTAIAEVSAEFPETIDYVDLRGCLRLGRIPSQWTERWKPMSSDKEKAGGMRTLYLSGSAVKSPPATLHGVGKQNVAIAVRHYFREIKEIGPGSFLRCKILLLGNGGAGKTTLSLSLEGKTEHPGSTHGIRLEDWPQPGAKDGVDRMIWDFGGQEIYHNTHAIFLKTNAVFVILWDGQINKPTGADDHQWRPLNYWIDYISNYGPVAPRIAIVYNHWAKNQKGNDLNSATAPARKEELRRRIKEFTEPRGLEFDLYILDAREKLGDYEEFADWAERSTRDLARDQGEEVPCYWEIAAAIVKYWITKDDPKELTFTELREELESVLRSIENEMPVDSPRLRSAMINEVPIDKAAKDWGNSFSLLRRMLKARTFSLTDARMEHLLEFLHHSGMVYWKKENFQNKVIISQRWALDGIYTILSREKAHFKDLKEANGVFNYSRIEDLWREKHFSFEQKQLLMTYMEHAGACFALVPADQRPGKDTVYLSLAHLSSMDELGLQINWDQKTARKEFGSGLLHLGHWHAILRKLGKVYERDADYASDGFSLNVEGKQTVVVSVHIRSDGIGGTVRLLVEHPDADEQGKIEASMSALIRREIPPEEGGPRDAEETRDATDSAPAGEAEPKTLVFISYASPPEAAGITPEILRQYRESPEFVRMAVQDCNSHESRRKGVSRVHPIFDKDEKDGKGIRAFVDTCKTSDWMIMITSDRYWRSPWCLYEFISTRDEKGRSQFSRRIMAISLDDCGINDAVLRAQYNSNMRNVLEKRNEIRTLLQEVNHDSVERRKSAGEKIGEMKLEPEEKEIIDKLEKMEHRAELVTQHLASALNSWWNDCWDRDEQRCQWSDGAEKVKRMIEANLLRGTPNS